MVWMCVNGWMWLVVKLMLWSTWIVLIQLDLIVCSENGKASSTDILNSTDSMTTRKMKKSETEHLLSRLVHDKWLSEVKYTVSSRISQFWLLISHKLLPLFCERINKMISVLQVLAFLLTIFKMGMQQEEVIQLIKVKYNYSIYVYHSHTASFINKA